MFYAFRDREFINHCLVLLNLVVVSIYKALQGSTSLRVEI